MPPAARQRSHQPAAPIPWHGRDSAMLTVLLCGAALACLYPFAWMVLGAFKSNREIFHPLIFWPERFDWSYVRQLRAGTWFPWGRVFLNSCLAAGGQATGAVLLGSLAGYVLAQRQDRRPSWLLVPALIVIVLPPPALAVPLFTWLHQLRLLDSLPGVILPGMVSGLAVIYFTQAYRQLPPALLDAARVEGASELRIFWLTLPLMRSALLCFGLIQFILAWHQHLIPLLVLQSSSQQTLPLALSALYGSSLRFPYAVLMAGSTLTVIPSALLFALFYQRLKSALSDLLTP